MTRFTGETKNSNTTQYGLEETQRWDNTLHSEEFGKVHARTILRIPREQQIDRALLLKVTTMTGDCEYNPSKKTDKDIIPIPPRLFDLRAPTASYAAYAQTTAQYYTTEMASSATRSTVT
eukprot:2926253-Amphidinium_carterae.3